MIIVLIIIKYNNNFEELLEDYKRKEVSLLDKLLINKKFDNYQDIILDIKKSGEEENIKNIEKFILKV